MSPARNVRRAISTIVVPDRDIDDFQVQLGGAKQQIEVAKRIKVAKVGPVAGQKFVIITHQRLGSAQGILNGLAENPGKEKTKGFIRT